jgi:hypothetical protein
MMLTFTYVSAICQPCGWPSCRHVHVGLQPVPVIKTFTREGQEGHKDAMFKMTNRASLAQQLTLSVSNQNLIEQMGILAVISSA